ncbi:hypothetical protein NQZ68_000566 [Dissostichus eleginoides]|nr:hypothetical protein NQZ68_000566 [Dissostichus eleginoides]
MAVIEWEGRGVRLEFCRSCVTARALTGPGQPKLCGLNLDQQVGAFYYSFAVNLLAKRKPDPHCSCKKITPIPPPFLQHTSEEESGNHGARKKERDKVREKGQEDKRRTRLARARLEAQNRQSCIWRLSNRIFAAWRRFMPTLGLLIRRLLTDSHA